MSLAALEQRLAHDLACLNIGEADGVFQVSLSAQSLAAYREKFPACLDADTFEIQ